jgi:hypothetical protein
MTDKNNKEPAGFGALPSPKAKLRPRSTTRRTHAIDTEIGNKMRAMYDDLVNQPIPERFVELLEQLDRARENKSQ